MVARRMHGCLLGARARSGLYRSVHCYDTDFLLCAVMIVVARLIYCRLLLRKRWCNQRSVFANKQQGVEVLTYFSCWN